MMKFSMLKYSYLIYFLNIIFVVLSYFVGIKEYAFFLFLAVFASFFAMIIWERKEKIAYEELWRNCTKWSKAIAFVSFAYGFINFFLCIYFLREGGPYVDQGVYCIWNHGFIREITKEEYERLLLVEGRMITGHMLIFSAFPMLFFSARHKIRTHEQMKSAQEFL